MLDNLLDDLTKLGKMLDFEINLKIDLASFLNLNKTITDCS